MSAAFQDVIEAIAKQVDKHGLNVFQLYATVYIRASETEGPFVSVLCKSPSQAVYVAKYLSKGGE